MADRPVVSELEETWRSLLDIGAGLGEDDWDRPTDCPGWTVRDQYSHVIGTEVGFLGRAAQGDDPLDGFGPHVRNDIGRFNEREITARSARPGAEVLRELAEVTTERLAALRSMSDEDFAAESWTPAGPGTYETFMHIRVFDCWVHEQDVRRAVGRPGHLSGPAAERALDQVVGATPYVVGKKAGAPDGAIVGIAVTGPVERRWAVTVEGRRARPLPDPPVLTTTTVTAEFPVFMALSCGRRALEPGDVDVAGDEDLGRAVAANLAFTI